ncbi:hypothetical protein KCU89_g52, partial [Aureobasidium melanogenum]
MESPQVAGVMQSGTGIVQSLENYCDNATQQVHFESAALGPSMMSANHMLPMFPNPGAGVQNYFPGLPYGAIPNTYGQLSYLSMGTPSVIVLLPMTSIPSFGYHSQHILSNSDPHLCSGPPHGGPVRCAFRARFSVVSTLKMVSASYCSARLRCHEYSPGEIPESLYKGIYIRINSQVSSSCQQRL